MWYTYSVRGHSPIRAMATLARRIVARIIQRMGDRRESPVYYYTDLIGVTIVIESDLVGAIELELEAFFQSGLAPTTVHLIEKISAKNPEWPPLALGRMSIFRLDALVNCGVLQRVDGKYYRTKEAEHE